MDSIKSPINGHSNIAIKQLNNGFNGTKEIIYPNLANQVDTSLKTIKGFLPYLEYYSFLDAYLLLEKMYCLLVESDKEISTIHSYEHYRTKRNLLNAHAILKEWDVEKWHHKKLDNIFKELFDSKDYTALNLFGYLDNIMILFAEDLCDLWPKDLIVLGEFKKALIRIYSLQTNTDFSDYFQES